MDVYEYAMQMEKDGEALYRDGARLSAIKGLSAILTMLADAEVRHYALFRAMKEHTPFSLPDDDILKEVKNIFVRMREEGEIESIGTSQTELYEKAQDIERRSEDFYRERGSKADDAAERGAFLKVADEESRHYFLLQRIIDFVSRPMQWLEDAEWYHLDEY